MDSSPQTATSGCRLNESPSEKEGKFQTPSPTTPAPPRRNESPSQKEGKIILKLTDGKGRNGPQ